MTFLCVVLRNEGLQVLECARPIPDCKKDDPNFINHGGIAIIGPNNIKISKLPFTAVTTFECLCVRITSLGSTCAVALIYRSGSQNVSQTFFKEFSKLLEYMSTLAVPMFITGDINLPLIKPDHPNSVQFYDLLSSYGLLQHVTQPTHDGGGLLDIVLSRDDVPNLQVKISDVGLSDHCLLTWAASLGRPNPVYKTTVRRRWKDFNADLFRTTLSQSKLCDSEFISTQLDPDDMTNLYNETITEILDVQAPFRTTTFRKRPSDPWYDAECRAAKQSTRKLERRYNKTKSAADRSAWCTSLKSQHALAGRKKREFWVNKINSTTNPRLLWQSIDEISGRSSSKIKDQSCLSASDLSASFEEKIRRIKSSTDNAPDPTFTPAPTGCSFQAFTPLTSDQISQLIQAAPNKSCDLDPLPTKLLKECADLLSPYIAKLFNLSLEKATVPRHFKTAHITPLVKKPGLDPDQSENYRPISNLSFLSKLLERVVFTQIEFYLDASKLLPSHQSAYRKFHSTETLLARVASDLISNASNGKHTLLAMLDLSAAFDTVDHTILLKRLSRSFGISDQALRWFTSYLTDRFQSVHFAGKTSSSTLVSCGVPQGSVLGPLLFLLYTADIGSIASKYNITSHSFADDTQLYLSGDPSEAQFLRSSTVACINEITEWCAANKLKLNPNKTEFLWSATARRQDQLDYTSIHLSDGDIRPSKVVRNLGVLIDSQLSFSQHVNNITSKSYSELRRLKSFRRSLPLHAARTLVNSLVVSRIDYCNCLLAGAPAKITDKLQSVMNAAAKIVCGLKKYDHIKQHMLRHASLAPCSTTGDLQTVSSNI